MKNVGGSKSHYISRWRSQAAQERTRGWRSAVGRVSRGQLEDAHTSTLDILYVEVIVKHWLTARIVLMLNTSDCMGNN
jgi:hypothetical protein